MEDARTGPVAEVTLDSLTTGSGQRQRTGPDGQFHFANLPPGGYALTIWRAGLPTTRLWALVYARTTTSLDVGGTLPTVGGSPNDLTEGESGSAGPDSSRRWGLRHDRISPSPGPQEDFLGAQPAEEEGERIDPFLGAFAGPATREITRIAYRFPSLTSPDLGPLVLPSPWDLSPALEKNEEEREIPLVIKAGTPLRVALDERVTLGHVGQAVLGTLIETVYAFDRIVLPAGTKVIGHVDKLEPVTGRARLQAILRGDLSPLRRAVLRFDTLVLSDCSEVPIATEVDGGTENVAVETAGGSQKAGRIAQARQELAQRMEQALAPLRGEDRLERLKEAVTGRLPYHRQYLHRGTVYQAELLSPLDFGVVRGTEWALPGTPAPPESVLRARLLTPLDSARTPRGTPIRAVLTEPLFSSDQRLILPEGSELQGEVTFAKGARKFHHNGQLRFLFETVQLPGQGPEKLLASLYSVELSHDEHVSVDDEGGTSISNSKTRFIAPAVALLAVRGSMDREGPDRDDIGAATDGVRQGNVGSRGLGGYLGLGFLGVGLSQVSRPVAVALSFVGLARTAYGSLFGKGREVTIPARTPIKLQLPPPAPPASAGP